MGKCGAGVNGRRSAGVKEQCRWDALVQKSNVNVVTDTILTCIHGAEEPTKKKNQNKKTVTYGTLTFAVMPKYSPAPYACPARRFGSNPCSQMASTLACK